jgi:exopolysaccharide biosynthesis polyprenyl glycosylphosphotransferase
LEAIYERTPFDRLLVSGQGPGTAREEVLLRLLNFCEEKAISVYMVPGFLDVVVKRTEIGSIAGIPFVRLQDSSIHPLYSAVKRLMDVAVSLAILTLGLPLWLAIALLIRVTSQGPVFFVQVRSGLHGRPFRMFKFRSMIDHAEERLGGLVDFDALPEPVFKLREDPRVTALGRILRRTSLDEVPQFLNVLWGTMSIVGPRPEQLELVQRYNDHQRRRLKAKPGITGYQQVMSRGDLSLAKRIEYDLYYLKYQSLFMDLAIMARTLLVVLRGERMA